MGAPSSANAQAAPVRLVVSTARLDQAPPREWRGNYLRPNNEQEVWTYLHNTTDQPQTVTVQLLANGEMVEQQKAVVVKPKDFFRLTWHSAAATARGKPATLEDAGGPLAFRLLDDKDAPLGPDVEIDVDRPKAYIQPPQLSYKPATPDRPNRLSLTVEPQPVFRAPPAADVELVLDPRRIPGLRLEAKNAVVAGGRITGPEGLPLVAEGLPLGDKAAAGLASLNIDQYPRAFTYKVDFPPAGKTESKSSPLAQETLYLDAPAAYDPARLVPVTVEADNLKNLFLRDGDHLRLDVLTSPAGEKESFSTLADFTSERRVRFSFAAGGPHGGVRVKPEVTDWKDLYDLSPYPSPVVLRLRLLGKDNKEHLAQNAATWEQDVKEVRRTIVLDKTPPVISSMELWVPRQRKGKVELVRLEGEERTVYRGKRLTVRAAGDDPESGVSDVAFFIGRPLPGGKEPDRPLSAPGKRDPNVPHAWYASLVVPADQRVPLIVTARFTNGVGLSKTEEVVLDEVADLPAALAGRKGAIAGVVEEGGRAQAGLVVELHGGARGGKIKETKTAEDGSFLFDDLDPGTYRVVCAKGSDNTKGESVVDLAPGERKEGDKAITVKLWR
jgi:hypothetical protein